MKGLEITIGKPDGKPFTITITGMHKDYSDVKLYYPKDEQGRPLIAPKKQWYVWYSYRNPFTGFLEKFKDTCKINKFKTVAERMEAGKAWVKAYQLLLDNGFNPYEAKGIEDKDLPEELNANTYTVRSGLSYAYDNQLGTWKPSTASDYLIRLGVFLEYAEMTMCHELTHLRGYISGN